jgi:hypothetical protein
MNFRRVNRIEKLIENYRTYELETIVRRINFILAHREGAK